MQEHEKLLTSQVGIQINIIYPFLLLLKSHTYFNNQALYSGD